MKIQDWFDVKNPEHIEAFSHLEETGTWPVGFIPKNVNIDCSICWQVMLYSKLAGAYIADFKKKQEHVGMPTWKNIMNYQVFTKGFKFGYIGDACETCNKIGYPYFSWNGWIYDDKGKRTEWAECMISEGNE